MKTKLLSILAVGALRLLERVDQKTAGAGNAFAVECRGSDAYVERFVGLGNIRSGEAESHGSVADANDLTVRAGFAGSIDDIGTYGVMKHRFGVARHAAVRFGGELDRKFAVGVGRSGAVGDFLRAAGIEIPVRGINNEQRKICRRLFQMGSRLHCPAAATAFSVTRDYLCRRPDFFP